MLTKLFTKETGNARGSVCIRVGKDSCWCCRSTTCFQKSRDRRDSSKLRTMVVPERHEGIGDDCYVVTSWATDDPEIN